MFRTPFKMTLLASTSMASQPPADDNQVAEQQPGPNIGSAQQAEGTDLPEGFTSWEDYNQKGGVLEAVEDTTTGAAGADTLEGAEAPSGEETPEQKATRVAETVALSVDGMAPEMAEKVTPFVKAWAETGTLTDAEVKDAAAATGMSEAMVRQYMAGATALQQQNVNAASIAQAEFVAPFYKEFGGEAAYGEFQKWTTEKGNLSPEEEAAFNDALDTSPQAALLLAKQFKARMEGQGAGDDPVDLTRGTGATVNSENQGYASMAEQEADQNDPRYRSDPAFREQVYAKVAKSNF